MTQGGVYCRKMVYYDRMQVIFYYSMNLMLLVANLDLCSATKKIPFFKPVCERVIGALTELFYSGLQLCSDSPLFDNSFHKETTNRELPNGKI